MLWSSNSWTLLRSLEDQFQVPLPGSDRHLHIKCSPCESVRQNRGNRQLSQVKYSDFTQFINQVKSKTSPEPSESYAPAYTVPALQPTTIWNRPFQRYRLRLKKNRKSRLFHAQYFNRKLLQQAYFRVNHSFKCGARMGDLGGERQPRLLAPF